MLINTYDDYANSTVATALQALKSEKTEAFIKTKTNELWFGGVYHPRHKSGNFFNRDNSVKADIYHAYNQDTDLYVNPVIDGDIFNNDKAFKIYKSKISYNDFEKITNDNVIPYAQGEVPLIDFSLQDAIEQSAKRDEFFINKKRNKLIIPVHKPIIFDPQDTQGTTARSYKYEIEPRIFDIDLAEEEIAIRREDLQGWSVAYKTFNGIEFASVQD